MTYITDGYHLYESGGNAQTNYGLAGGAWLQVRDVCTDVVRMLSPLELSLCQTVVRSLELSLCQTVVRSLELSLCQTVVRS